jgi:acetyl esterase/lipase
MSSEAKETDPEQPARTRLLRELTGSIVRPFFHPWVPVPAKRQGLRLASRIARPIRGTRTRAIELAGVPVEEVVHEDGGDFSVIYLHGGVYCVGSPATHRAITSRIAHQTGARVLAVDYRLAPEHPFPAALEDALAVYEHLLDTGEKADQIALAGDSAGGGLALSTVLAAREAGLETPAALWLMSPWVDLTLSNSGYASPREYMLSWPGLAQAARLYAPGATDDPLASPLRGDLVGLPPMLLQAGSEEILLAETQQLFEKARHSGVDVRLNVFEGFWHVFQVHAGLLAGADRALAEGTDFLRDHAGAR